MDSSALENRLTGKSYDHLDAHRSMFAIAYIFVS